MKTLHAVFWGAVAVALPMHAAPTKPAAKSTTKKLAKPASKPAAKLAKLPVGMVVAKFVLPDPSYLGTPKAVKDTDAEDPKKHKLRGPVYLPKGALNLAAGKKVTSSDDAPIIGALALLTDGDKKANEGSWVELGPGTQWVQIDLGKTASINGVLLWHYHGEARVYRDVVVQLADDADFVTNVRTVYNNDKDNSSGLGAGKGREFYEYAEGQWIPVAAQKARYVRLYSRGNTSEPQNQYIEAEVWGK